MGPSWFCPQVLPQSAPPSPGWFLEPRGRLGFSPTQWSHMLEGRADSRRPGGALAVSGGQSFLLVTAGGTALARRMDILVPACTVHPKVVHRFPLRASSF